MPTPEIRNNPFRPTFGVPPHYWAGRRIILDEFDDALTKGPGAAARSLVISGSRGIGKTVLLNEIEDVASRRGWIILSVSGRGNLVSTLVDSVIPEKIRELSPARNRRISGVSISGIGSVRTEDVDSSEPVPTLDSRLRELLALLDGTGVLVTVDEVQDATTEDLSVIAGAYQGLLRREADVALAMAGLTYGVDELLRLPGTTFLRRSRRYDLGPLTDDDAEDVLETTAGDSGLPFTVDALDLAADIAQGYPYLVQLLGSLAWDRAHLRGESTISAASVETEKQETIMTMGTNVHYPSLRDLPQAQHAYLSALADLGDGPQPTAGVAEKLGKTQRTASDTRAQLIQRDLIAPVGRGKVEFTLPYLGDWLRGPGTVRRVQ
ncbi:MAG: AAA family ATPase [Corynebacterium sp.]|uniref:ATP-binding protein n=1 Tax=Corynebacterium sp. TaxID=1720 RepID=UPI003F9EB9AA